MRNHLMFPAVALTVVLFSAPGLGRAAEQSGTARSEPAVSQDLTGVIWMLAGGNTLALSDAVPPRTLLGEAKFQANKPSYGPRAVPPAVGNDPIGYPGCDPLGTPRILFYRTPMEFVEIPGRVIIFFERTHVWRTIWTDGRSLPDNPEPRWNGHSVGRWDGGTFVIDSIGFDERTWLDHFGNPHSDAMRLQERWRRADEDTLELTMTLYDPETYATAWRSDTKVYRRDIQTELGEGICVPSEEEAFNKRIRDPAGGVTSR